MVMMISEVMRFEIFWVLKIWTIVFWIMTSCSLVGGNPHKRVHSILTHKPVIPYKINVPNKINLKSF
jgi:hypothetical protein